MDHPNCASYLSYTISGALFFFGDVLAWINTNAAACGVALGLMTYLTDLYFKRKNYKAIVMRRRLGDE